MPPMKKTTSPITCGTAYGSDVPCWWTISVSRIEPAIITTPSTLSASDTSYETSCAQVRIEPRSEYFESEAQPPPGAGCLRAGAQAADKEAVDADRAEREDQDQADRDVGDLAVDPPAV